MLIDCIYRVAVWPGSANVAARILRALTVWMLTIQEAEPKDQKSLPFNTTLAEPNTWSILSTTIEVQIGGSVRQKPRSPSLQVLNWQFNFALLF